MAKRAVLVADDEEIIRDLLSKILGRLGFESIVAESGREAVDACRKHAEKIDLAIIDLIMPGLSGVETIRELKNVKPGLKVILSSGETEMGDDKLRAMSADGYLTKPYRIDQLQDAVEAVLEK